MGKCGGGRDGKLIKLSLIYPSPRGRPTRGISRSSIFVLTLCHRQPFSFAIILLSVFLSPFSRYLFVSLSSLLFVSLRFRTPRTRDFKQLKQSAKHFNLASGASTPRADVDTHLFVFSSSSDLISPLLSCVFLVLSIAMPGRRRRKRERERKREGENGEDRFE